MTINELFDKEFVRDDGLMDKYSYELSGDPIPTSEAIKAFYTDQFQELLKAIMEKKRYEKGVYQSKYVIEVEDILSTFKEIGIPI